MRATARHSWLVGLALVGAVLLAPAELLAVPQGQVTTTRVDSRPAADKVGGFQLSIFGGVQLRGSASGQGGFAIAYLKPSTAALGAELEGSFTRGPRGQVYMGMLSFIMQSGVRTSRLVPFLAIGAGGFYAREEIPATVAEALPQFGIIPVNQTETGAVVSFGFGARYYLSDNVSFRFDYREFRAITGAGGGLFDKLYSMRRIAGFLSFDL